MDMPVSSHGQCNDKDKDKDLILNLTSNKRTFVSMVWERKKDGNR